MIEYIAYKNSENEVIETSVPFKKDGIYCLTGEENYWLISCGKKQDLQNPFIEKGIIGISWDKINLEQVRNSTEEELSEKLLENYQALETRYQDYSAFKRYISSVITKLKRFVTEMNLGDIIVLKDRGSNKIYFGKIISEAEDYSNNDLYVDEITGYCNKIRKVRWLKSTFKDDIGSELKLALSARHALSLIKQDKVKEEVNREVFSYFYRGDNLHIVFKVKLDTDISQDNFKEFQDYIHELKKKCISETNTENIFNIKTNVQSPGPIEFFGNPQIVSYIFGVITGVGGIAVSKYLKTKRKLKIEDPKKQDDEIDDGFSEGN